MADESPIPARVNHYKILKTIGKGNFAVVKLARHAITNSKVAIKIIPIKSLDPDQLRKLNREIEIMKHIRSHKNIVKLYQVMQSDRHVMLVTEYCSGGEIFDQLVNNGRMPENKARAYFIQILDAVEYLHTNGIVHRDLKAENLLLSADYKVVKLADFGFSNYFTSSNLLTTWCGSPPYAPPELFDGRPYIGPKADIWSLGVVLYVFVCGALPFDGNPLHSLKMRVLSGKFRIPYFMSCDCEHLIRHMLVVDPDKRYSLAQIRQHKWTRTSLKAELDNSAEKLSETLQNCHLNESGNDSLGDLDMSIIEGIASQLNVEPKEVLTSVTTRQFDQFYALYHLVNDASQFVPASSSAPPSPPLLPIIPSTSQRKSSITTGVVEREPTPTNLVPNVSSVRRHTFGPETNAADGQSAQLIAPPALYLTPPMGAATMMLPIANLPFAPPNYPITNMDLLKPPPVLLMANNNMGRRASDGQANYARASSDTCTKTSPLAQPARQQQSSSQCCASPSKSSTAYNQQSKVSSHQATLPFSYFKRKRHSLTDTNEITSRQRRFGFFSNFGNSMVDRSRRRASDGCGVLNSSLYQQHISISTLQNELRALCVSSPPSLHSSPVHVSSVAGATAGTSTAHTSHGKNVKTSSSAATAATATATGTLPPTSPPSPILPLISEENTLGLSNAKSEEDMTSFDQHQQQQQQQQQTSPTNNKHSKPLFGGGFLAKGFASGAGAGTPLLTPPHSFRSSPVTSPNAMAPFIAITDELGAMQFPILAPPTDFQLVSSIPNLNNDADKSPEQLFNKLHRWNNDENILSSSGQRPQPEPMFGATYSEQLLYNNRAQSAMPSTTATRTTMGSSSEHSPSEQWDRYDPLAAQPSNSSMHYSSLQCLYCTEGNGGQCGGGLLTTTDSGSICIKDTVAANKLLTRLGHIVFPGQLLNERHVLNFDESNLQIALEWNNLRQQLILRHVSGDASQYKNVCHELISTLT